MNNVSCTTVLTAGIGASVGAVVLVMLSLEWSIIRSIVGREEKTDPKWALFEEQSFGNIYVRIYEESKRGIGPILPLGRLLMRRDYGQSS